MTLRDCDVHLFVSLSVRLSPVPGGGFAYRLRYTNHYYCYYFIYIYIIIIIYARWQHDTKMAINNHDVVALSTLNVVPCTLPVMMLVIHRSIGDER